MRIGKISIKKIIILILLLLALVSLLAGVKNAVLYSQDFQWDSAKVLLMHMNPYDESLSPSDELLVLGYEEVYKQMEANQFPSLLLILAPYTLLKPLTARYAWIVSNIIFTLITILLLRLTFLNDMDKEDAAIVFLLMIAGTPWRNHIGVGQHTVFSFMFFLLAVYLSQKESGGRVILSALSLAVSYFKYTLTAPLALYFVYKKKYKLLLLSVLPHIVLTCFSAWWVNDSFINMIKKPLMVASVLTSEGGMDIGSLTGAAEMAMPIAFIIMLALFVLMLCLPEHLDKEVISLLLLWSLVMIYHRSYDYFVMVVPLGILFDRMESEVWGHFRRLARCYYCILTLGVFFGLRFFDETRLSLNVCAIFYYIFVVCLSGLLIKACSQKKITPKV